MKLLLRALMMPAMMVLCLAARAADGSSLKPPPGAKVAIVMFEDLECPTCARAYPIVREAGKAHKVPVVLHDFPLKYHPWSFDAAVYARFFDTKSEKLGNDFRAHIYSNQPDITKTNLREYVEKFANENKVPLPSDIDSDGKLKDKVVADRDLGTHIGLQHTPTIFVIGDGGPATPPVEVEVDDYGKLGQIVEDMQRKAGSDIPAKLVSSKAKKEACSIAAKK